LSTLPTDTPRISSISERERLEGGGAQTRGPRRELRALDGFGVLGPCEDLPSAADLHELDAVAIHVVVLAQLVERSGERGLRCFGVECSELLARNRASAGKQRRFKQLR
jgi:hypothetical protein